MAVVDIDNNYYNIKGYQNGPRASFFLSLFVEQRTLPLSPRVMRVIMYQNFKKLLPV